jgi:hypothetical protein
MNNFARVIRAELESTNHRSDYFISKPSSAWEDASDAFFQDEEDNDMNCRFFQDEDEDEDEDDMQCIFFIN